MEHLGLWLYLADFVDNVDTFFTIAFFVILMYWITKRIFIAIYNNEYGHNEEKLIFKFKRIEIIGFVICSLVCIFMPSQKTIYLILGADASKQIATTETGQKTINLLNLMLDKHINDLKRDK